MKNSLFLFFFLLGSSCATEPTTKTPTAQTSPSKENQPLIQENIFIGMSRAEAEDILGNPTSLTDTETGTTAVWVFGPGASKANPPTEPTSKLISQIGSIAGTVVGIFSPIAGVATNVGSQIYNVINSGDEKAASSNETEVDDTRIVTIEFRDNKVFSIQRARATTIPTTPRQ